MRAKLCLILNHNRKEGRSRSENFPKGKLRLHPGLISVLLLSAIPVLKDDVVLAPRDIKLKLNKGCHSDLYTRWLRIGRSKHKARSLIFKCFFWRILIGYFCRWCVFQEDISNRLVEDGDSFSIEEPQKWKWEDAKTVVRSDGQLRGTKGIGGRNKSRRATMQL